MATGAQAVRNETNQAVFRLAASAIGGRRGALPATDPDADNPRQTAAGGVQNAERNQLKAGRLTGHPLRYRLTPTESSPMRQLCPA